MRSFIRTLSANCFLLLALRLCVSAVVLASTIHSQTAASGGPGKDAQWATAGKQAVGTSASLESKVWFTLAQGVMTEVYYPDVTVANVHLLQFVVVDPKTKKVETEQDDAFHEIKVLRPDSLTFQQVNTARSGKWKITKTYVTDPNSDAVLIDVRFEQKVIGLSLYAYFDPSIANSGMGDRGYDGALSQLNIRYLESTDSQMQKSSYLLFSSPISEVYSGYKESGDEFRELRELGKLPQSRSITSTGNIVQMAKVDSPSHFTTVLAFANPGAVPPFEPMQRGFEKARAEYEKGWADYVKALPKVDPKYQAQFNMAAMQLKALEDKTKRGANIASLTVPWGGGANANENNVGGYHLVWARDLYQVFTAYMALGDRAAATRALDFLFNVQQKSDGSFPQNSWLDGKPFWNSLQMDEVAFPLIMAWQLRRFDKPTYENHVKKAADFIVRNGPKTPQERWEEEGGYSPSTIAAEIAGLVCAADIAKKNRDEASALIWLAAADDWARNVERWTATTNGKYGDGNYYLRITQNGKPDAGDKIELNNGAGTFDERDIVDAGFLELVRLGLKSPDDPLIAKSVKVIDQVIKVETPNGPGFYRYNNDGYGEMDDGRRWNWDGKYTGKGRLWVLLSGERGEYELAIASLNSVSPFEQGKDGVPVTTRQNLDNLAANLHFKNQAEKRLDTMLAFANEGRMIPEQVWDKKEIPKNVDKQFIPELKFGEGTGSATPLAWSMAQFIRLATNIKAGRNLDTPQVVADRYRKGVPGQVSDAGGTDIEFTLPPLKPGETIIFPRNAKPGTKIAYSIIGESKIAEADAQGKVTLEFSMPDADTVATLGIMASDGATAFERVTLRVKAKTQEFSPALIEKIKAAKTSPFVNDGKAVFFYRGVANQISVAGDMTSWNPGRISMQKIADDLQAVQVDVGPSARVEYKFVVDGKWILDPLNASKQDNGVGGENSILAMPGYKPSTFAKDVPGLELNNDTLQKIEINSKVLGEVRTIVVSASILDEQERNDQPVLYFQDGGDYVKRAKALEVWSRLISDKKVKPFIMVFIDPKDRSKEYWANDKWADFVANEVVPEIDKRYHTVATREGRATLGASLGGITSIWIGLRHPDKFARLGGQSSSFWVDNERVVKELEKLDPAKTKFRFYLDDGTLEGAEDTRRVNVMLRGKGFPVTYVEGETGHNWTAWRDRLADAFIALWQN